MKNLLYILIAVFGISCAKKNEGSPEPLAFYNFIYFVNEDTVNLFKTELVDTTDITFEYLSVIRNWEEQKAINLDRREIINRPEIGFTNNVDLSDEEKQRCLDFLDNNKGYMVFDHTNRPGNVTITTKNKTIEFFNKHMVLTRHFEINGTTLDCQIVFYDGDVTIGIFIVFVPDELLK